MVSRLDGLDGLAPDSRPHRGRCTDLRATRHSGRHADSVSIGSPSHPGLEILPVAHVCGRLSAVDHHREPDPRSAGLIGESDRRTGLVGSTSGAGRPPPPPPRGSWAQQPAEQPWRGGDSSSQDARRPPSPAGILFDVLLLLGLEALAQLVDEFHLFIRRQVRALIAEPRGSRYSNGTGVAPAGDRAAGVAVLRRPGWRRPTPTRRPPSLPVVDDLDVRDRSGADVIHRTDPNRNDGQTERPCTGELCEARFRSHTVVRQGEQEDVGDCRSPPGCPATRVPATKLEVVPYRKVTSSRSVTSTPIGAQVVVAGGGDAEPGADCARWQRSGSVSPARSRRHRARPAPAPPGPPLPAPARWPARWRSAPVARAGEDSPDSMPSRRCPSS